MAGDGSGNDRFATPDYGYATRCHRVTDPAMMGTKFWRRVVGLCDDGYKSGNDRSCVGRRRISD